MATYEVGEEVQFVRQVTKNPDRVVNIDEKGQIIAVAPDGSYTVKLLSEDTVSGINDDEIEPSAEIPGDSVPTDSQEHPAPTTARDSSWSSNADGASEE